MVLVKSERAKAYLEQPKCFLKERQTSMRKYPKSHLNLWALKENEGETVKKLSFFGDIDSYLISLLEAVGAMVVGKKNSRLTEINLREVEAFLRDKNSVSAFEGLNSQHEQELKDLLIWLSRIGHFEAAQEYRFDSGTRSFSQLGLVDKIRELKAFLNSFEVHEIYSQKGAPELIDVQDLTVYLGGIGSTEDEIERLENLHKLAVMTFREPELNLIPDV